jgi:hypothetical protein
MTGRPRFYLVTVGLMALVCFWGFTQTYFISLLLGRPSAFGGLASNLPLIVHAHGWSFFAWYLLMVVQVTLVAGRRVKLHRTLGSLSLVVVVAMVLSGVAVLVINAHLAAGPDAPPLFRFFGQIILATLVLFTVYYALAISQRRNAEHHKRWMLSAGAVGLGAAMFRVLLGWFGPIPLNVPLGILLCNAFIVAGMIHDRLILGRVHPVYWISLPVAVGVELSFLALPHTAAGAWLQDGLARLGEVLLFLYGAQ